MSVPIVYQDSAFIIVDKPAGVLSVPGRGPDKQDCVVNRVKRLVPDIPTQPAVHRLDMQTSGLMILAKTPKVHQYFSRQFEHRLVEKRYVAQLEGEVKASGGEIRLAFRLDPNHRPYQVYDPRQGKLGITRWKRISVKGGRTRLDLFPLTGRTHQLRLHCAHAKGLGTPIVGDQLYGSGQQGERMLLHACELRFRHPDSTRWVHFVSKVLF